MACHSGPTDALGRRLNKGDRVRVMREPDLTGMQEKARADFRAAFKALKRRPRNVLGFDGSGNAELAVRAGGKLHILALETELLEWTREAA